MKRLCCNTELTKTGAVLFKNYLHEHDIYFEASEAANLIHFMCNMTEDEMNEANTWLEKYLQ